ncbi:MAG: N-acetyl-gamma-glutamyl-phosphate reductase, partial [Planctomycetota bacterium]|nr:N-acetyl-gamma-glutamyl-phosphate reductase [Planctomycetota bacterium]
WEQPLTHYSLPITHYSLRMIRVGIVGSTGMVGEGLIQIILGHPEAEITFLGSRHAAGKKIQEILPKLRGAIDLTCEDITPERLIDSSDVVFLASKTPEVMALVPPLLEAGRKVIDIGAEFRLKSAETYEAHYKTKHLCPEILERAVYGLPELFREQIISADLVANPGCYATTAILAITPLVASGKAVNAPIPIDAFSGLSGGGRTYNETNLFVHCNENVKGYKLGTHRHAPEMEQAIEEASGRSQRVIFFPHVVPLDRGIYSTSFLETTERLKQSDVLAIYRDFYDGEPFIRITDDPSLIDLQGVRDTNLCDISIFADPGSNKVMVFSATDNMIKGASGQAVQNMNLIFGREETTGLLNRRFF